MRKIKGSISIILVLTILTSFLPIMTYAEGVNAAKHDNPWDYAIFGNSIKIPINVHGSSIKITGDIHANDGINCLASEITVDGSAEANGAITFGDTKTDGNQEPDVNVGEIINNAENLELKNIYALIADSVKNKSDSSVSGSISELLSKNTVSYEDINIISEDEQTELKYNTKFGAFSAKFIADMYSNQEVWGNVLPAFAPNIAIDMNDDGNEDILDLINNSNFAAVGSEYPASGWYNTDKIPADTFMNNLNENYIDESVDQAKSNYDLSTVCSGENVVTVSASWNKSTVNPQEAVNAEKLTVTGGNITLNGQYDSLKELELNNNGTAQLIGDYPNLEYIYTNNYISINLAGNFPALKAVYMPGGQLILGNSATGFNAVGANIINEYGNITVYTENDTEIENSKILTKSKIAIRGRQGQKSSCFIAPGSMFAAGNALVIGDINDANTVKFDEVPSFFSQNGISIINSDFKLLQGYFVSRNGAMVFSDSEIDVFRGFLFSQKGISENQFSAKESVYCDGEAFNQPTGLTTGSYMPSGSSLGRIYELNYASVPQSASDIASVEQFCSASMQLKDGEKYADAYSIGVENSEDDIIYILSENDINITTGSFNTPAGKKVIIASQKGDVRIKAADGVDFDGVIYAPNGVIDINSPKANINGNLYGDVINVSVRLLNMNSVEDEWASYFEEISDGVIFEMPDFCYVEDKDLYIYDKDIAQEDYSLTTGKDVETIYFSIEYLYDGTEEKTYYTGAISRNPGKLFSAEYMFLENGINDVKITVYFTDKTKYETECRLYKLDESNSDADNDGLTDDDEFFFNIDKTNPDTDGDGFSDKYEITHGMNPLVQDTVSVDSSVIADIHDNKVDDLETLNLDEYYPLEIEFSDEDTQLTSISGKFSDLTVESPNEAIYSIYSVKSLLGIDNPKDELKFDKLNHSKSGETFTFLQYYNGIEVYGSSLTVSSDTDGKTTSLHSSVVSNSILENVILTPEISENDLQNIIDKEYDNAEILSSKLVIYSDEDNLTPSLTYVVIIDKAATSITDTVFIDAITGNIKYSFENIEYDQWDSYEVAKGSWKGEIDGINSEIEFPVSYNRNSGYYFLADIDRQIKVFNIRSESAEEYSSKNNIWSDLAAVLVYDNARTTYDWWKLKFNYRGLDGNGGTVNVYVHDKIAKNTARYIRPNENNIAAGLCAAISFGDSDGSQTKAFALDRVGHEYTHAVINHKASIKKRTNEPGTINEAYADIFGSFINNNTWRTEPRYIANPTKTDCPITVGDENYLKYSIKYDDNIERQKTHTNSTIISHAAYLMQSKYNISFDKLYDLWYDSIAEGFDDKSDFNTVMENVIKSARKNNFTYDEISNIRKAFNDVGIENGKGNAEISIYDGEEPVENAKITLINYGDLKSNITGFLGETKLMSVDAGTNTLKIEIPGRDPILTQVLIKRNKTVKAKINVLTSISNFNWSKYDHYDYEQPFISAIPKHIVFNGSDIKMIGYSQDPLKDFLLTNGSEDDASFVNSTQKVLSFKIMRDANNWHTMEGGGFLFDVKINNNNLYGHCILATENGLKLYEINGVDIDKFRNGELGNISNVGNLLGTYNIGNVLLDHTITIRITKSFIGKQVSLWDGDALIIDNKTLLQLYGEDFGPITSHAKHYCDQISYFTFSDIQMSSISKTVSDSASGL